MTFSLAILNSGYVELLKCAKQSASDGCGKRSWTVAMTIVYIREYGSTLYVGMVSVVSYSLYICIGAKIRNRLKTAGKRLKIDQPCYNWPL